MIYYGVLAQLGSEEPRIMIGSTILMPSLRGAITLLRATMRVEVLHGEYFAALQSRGVPILLALWHGRMFLLIDAHRGQGLVTMASKSNDGDIIAGWLVPCSGLPHLYLVSIIIYSVPCSSLAILKVSPARNSNEVCSLNQVTRNQGI